jgi:WbqC-like protein family
MARVGIIQSSYIPWRGYFDFIQNVDLFLFLDDVQFSKGSWRNRNKIKTPDQVKWLTVPVKHTNLEQLIENTEIDYSKSWQQSHKEQFRLNYKQAPFLDDSLNLFDMMMKNSEKTISKLNVLGIKEICKYLGISTPLIMSSELGTVGSKTDRLIDLLKKVNATTYVSGPSADGYLDKALFKYHGIRLEYKSYDYEPYPQLWDGFEGAVTVLDLIANCGPMSKKYLCSSSSNIVVVA